MRELKNLCRDALRAIGEEKDGAGIMDMPTPLEQALTAFVEAEEPEPDYHLLEALADIAYAAGHYHYYGGDSRQDVADIIAWAQEFHAKHKDTDWDEHDYISTVDKFGDAKLTDKGSTRADLHAFEVRPVAEKGGNVYRCTPCDPLRFAFGIYGTDGEGLPWHVADFDTEAQAMKARDALNLCQGQKATVHA